MCSIFQYDVGKHSIVFVDISQKTFLPGSSVIQEAFETIVSHHIPSLLAVGDSHTSDDNDHLYCRG